MGGHPHNQFAWLELWMVRSFRPSSLDGWIIPPLFFYLTNWGGTFVDCRDGLFRPFSLIWPIGAELWRPGWLVRSAPLPLFFQLGRNFALKKTHCPSKQCVFLMFCADLFSVTFFWNAFCYLDHYKCHDRCVSYCEDDIHFCASFYCYLSVRPFRSFFLISI